MRTYNRLYGKRVSRPITPLETVKEENDTLSIVPVFFSRKNNDKFVNTLDVDQFSGQKFMMNPQGFVMNDIMCFEECQSDSVARSVLQRIKVMHPESISQDLTTEEMFASIIPANYGSPAEFVSSQKNIVRSFAKLRADAQQAQLANDAAALARQQIDVVDNPLVESVPNPE